MVSKNVRQAWVWEGPMGVRMGRTAQEHQLNRATPLDNHTGRRGWGLGRVHRVPTSQGREGFGPWIYMENGGRGKVKDMVKDMDHFSSQHGISKTLDTHNTKLVFSLY